MELDIHKIKKINDPIEPVDIYKPSFKGQAISKLNEVIFYINSIKRVFSFDRETVRRNEIERMAISILRDVASGRTPLKSDLENLLQSYDSISSKVEDSIGLNPNNRLGDKSEL